MESSIDLAMKSTAKLGRAFFRGELENKGIAPKAGSSISCDEISGYLAGQNHRREARENVR